MDPQDSAPHHRPWRNLHDLPLELLNMIMFLLPPSSILHLMVNRKLRLACEPYLYRNIDLGGQPYRSLYLLRTFALRPNLALVVRQLRINLKCHHPGVTAIYKIPGLLQPDSLAALSVAKDIQSLEISGLDWLTDPPLAHIREIVSQMELTSLTIVDQSYSSTTNDLEHNQMVASNLRTILLSQPKLEILCLASHHIKPILLDKIGTVDVPNLKHFRGPARFGKVFLNVAPKLDTLDLEFTNEDLSSFHNRLQERWDGHKIQDLRVTMCLDLVRDWDEFGGFLAQFPNTKSLKLLFTSCLTKRRLSRYLDNITACLHVLSLLRKLEIRVANQGPKAGALLKFKQECPSLEQFVDHEERGWVYIPSSDDGGGGFDARLEYQLVRRILRHDDDLPPPEWICSA